MKWPHTPQVVTRSIYYLDQVGVSASARDKLLIEEWLLIRYLVIYLGRRQRDRICMRRKGGGKQWLRDVAIVT